jgi:hypothetical protein
MVELQTFCREILGRILRDGRIVSSGNRPYCIAAKYDGNKKLGSPNLGAVQQKTSQASRVKLSITYISNTYRAQKCLCHAGMP